MFNIESRRYVGNKFKLIPWIKEKVLENCHDCNSFFDVFAGTGVVTAAFASEYEEFIVNDFLFSNEAVYKGFMEHGEYSLGLLENIKDSYNLTHREQLSENYVSRSFGDKYFSNNDAKIIGHIRENIDSLLREKKVNEKEYYILLASLLYSVDRIANTCGHYDAYIKGHPLKDSFSFELISPLDFGKKTVNIFRKDSNLLVKEITTDIAFIDPPYNSRQYSRFYHVLENITKWEKPELYGVALKPKEENMSEYCKTNAKNVFSDLIENLNTKYIVVTYNNTYNSKSSSSQNKITLEEIKEILDAKGSTTVYEKPYRFFNAGKTNLENHKEYLFITKVC